MPQPTSECARPSSTSHRRIGFRLGNVPERAARGERGAVLTLAIAFITVMSVLFASLLAFAFTSTSSLTSYRIERARRYAADSALLSAVHRVKQNATMGTSFTPSTCLTYDVLEDISSGNMVSAVSSGSTVIVTCVATPGSTVGVPDLDGGQAPRDITFTVICPNTGSTVTNRQLKCGSGSTNTVIGSARVRFDNDYDTTHVPANARAVVPKVISWSIRA